MIDKQASLRRNYRHNCNVARGLTKAIRQSLLVDYRRRAGEAAASIRTCLEPSAGETDLSGSYAILERWYRHTSTQEPKISQTDIEKVRGDFQTLYQQEDPQPPGLPLATHVEQVKVNNATPLEAEVETAVRCLRPIKSGGHTQLHAEQFQQWLWETTPRENSKTPLRTERWMCLVDIVQHMWRTGEIPQELGWNILVLIPKAPTDNWGIGLLETLWRW